MDRINSWLTLVSNVGVLLGILMVAYELRQNSLTVEAPTRSEIANQTSEALASIAANPQLIRAMTKDSRDEPLEDEERLTLFYWAQAMLRRWENMHYQYRVGMYTESEFVANLKVWRNLLETNGFLNEHYQRMRFGLSQEFVTEIEGNSRE